MDHLIDLQETSLPGILIAIGLPATMGSAASFSYWSAISLYNERNHVTGLRFYVQEEFL